MKKREILGIVAVIGVLVWAVASATSIPVVHKDIDGNCVRVIASEQGKAVERTCSTIDLQHDRYETVYVYGMDADVEALKAEMNQYRILQERKAELAQNAASE